MKSFVTAVVLFFTMSLAQADTIVINHKTSIVNNGGSFQSGINTEFDFSYDGNKDLDDFDIDLSEFFETQGDTTKYQFHFGFSTKDSVPAVPEPSSIVLLLAGLLLIAAVVRKHS